MSYKNLIPRRTDVSTLKVQAIVRSVAFLVILLIGISSQTFAISISQELDKSIKGYSIEQVPGRDKYIAAGTYYDYSTSQALAKGYHYSYFDASGNVLASKIHALPITDTRYELRVVDIVPIDADECWIIIQARDFNPTAHVNVRLDYIYAEKIEIATGNLSSNMPNTFKVVGTLSNGGANPPDQQMYPMHSVMMDGDLYICGYTLKQLLTPGTVEPTNFSLNKCGFIVRADFSLPNPFSSYWWDTPDGGIFDFDMATKMRVLDGGEILLTGAVNAGSTTSGVLAMRFNTGVLFPTQENAIEFLPSGIIYPPNTTSGVYGIDIYEAGNDVFVLTNDFEYNAPRFWGMLRLDNTLMADLTVPSCIGFYNFPMNNEWAKQIIHNSGIVSSDFSIIGERIGYGTQYCPISGVTSSVTNVHPFVTRYSFGFNASGIYGNWISDFTHVTSQPNGTSSSQVDYLTRTPNAVGTDLEDVSRLYTSATTNGQDLIILPPMVNSTNPSYLNSKFMRLSSSGSEGNCHNSYSICPPVDQANHVANNFMPMHSPTQYMWVLEQITMNRTDEAVIQNDCSTGVYKPASIAETKTLIETQIYPNPASTEVNIELAKTVSADNDIQVELVNMHGQVISRLFEGKAEVLNGNHTLKLPNVAVGLYMVFIYSNGERIHNQKLEIR